MSSIPLYRWVTIFLIVQSWTESIGKQKSMIHQENQAMIINTGSKQGITNPPYVSTSSIPSYKLIL